ncbi:MAG: NlpC/P60 family protein [Pseudomonadota bacterium]
MSGCGGRQLADAAASYIGARFRLHGRDPRTGLDCVGLVLISLHKIGRPYSDFSGYGLRNLSIGRFLEEVAPAGLTVAQGALHSGDVLLLKPGPAQHHLAIVGGGRTIIHAHAGLRRVVRQPLDASITPLAQWRLSEDLKGN